MVSRYEWLKAKNQICLLCREIMKRVSAVVKVHDPSNEFWNYVDIGGFGGDGSDGDVVVVMVMVVLVVMVMVMIWDLSVIWCFFLRPLLIKDKDNLIIFQVTAKLFHSIEKLPCASLTMTWTKRWRTRCIEYAGQAQQSRPSGRFLLWNSEDSAGVRLCLLWTKKIRYCRKSEKGCAEHTHFRYSEYHDEPIEWCFLGFGLNWEWL